MNTLHTYIAVFIGVLVGQVAGIAGAKLYARITKERHYRRWQEKRLVEGKRDG